MREDTAERVRGLYNYRRSRFAARFGRARTGSKNAPPPISACRWSCSGARQTLIRCVTRVRSGTRSCTASNATSTSKSRAWSSEQETLSLDHERNHMRAVLVDIEPGPTCPWGGEDPHPAPLKRWTGLGASH